MKPPPKKKRSELTVGELRDLERKEEAERQEWDRENEARIKSLDMRTEIQQALITQVERDIRICESRIDDMKEDYRDYSREHDFVDRLEELYGELGSLYGKLDAIKIRAFNDPIHTDTSNRNPSWVMSDVNSDSHFSVGYLDDDEGAMKMTAFEDICIAESDYPPKEFK